MNTCPKCGAELDEMSPHCPACLAPINAPELPEMPVKKWIFTRASYGELYAVWDERGRRVADHLTGYHARQITMAVNEHPLMQDVVEWARIYALKPDEANASCLLSALNRLAEFRKQL